MPYRRTRNPVIRLTSREWADFVADAKAYIKDRFPQWTDFLPQDLGVALVELFAGMTDYLTYYQNVTANECFLSTAQFRRSLFKLAKMIGYTPRLASAAQATLQFTKTSEEIEVTVPRGTRVTTSDGSLAFVTLEPLEIPAGQLTGEVAAIHGELVEGELLGVSTGQPYQRFQLANVPLALFADKKSSLVVYVDGTPWRETPAFIRSYKEDVYRVDVEPGAAPGLDVAVVVFGDGTFGNIPPQGAVITADYIYGGGRNGNVGAYTLNTLAVNIPGILSVTNPLPASGGEDAESDEELRQNVPLYVYTRRRLVTKPDYERLLGSFREVSRIHVEHPRDNVVEVYVFASGGELPSPALKAALQEYIDEHRIIDDDVRILDPILRPVDISADIVLISGVNQNEAVVQIDEDLRNFLDKRIFSRSIYIHDVYQFFSEHEFVQLATVKKMAFSGESGVQDLIVRGGEVIVPGVISLTVVEAM